MTQVVQTQECGYVGGAEGLGSKGGCPNVQVRLSPLLQFQTVQRWLRKRAPNTRAQYLSGFEKFLKWTEGGANPDQFLAWARNQPDGLTVQDFIDEYAETQSKGNAHTVTALLRSFLGRNGYRDLPKIDWESTVSFTEGYSRSEVQQLLSYLDSPLQKLYVLVAKDSGLRANDILSLLYKHVKPDFEAGKDIVQIRFEDERYKRRKAPGRTFLGPNSILLLRQLVKEGIVKAEPDSKIFPFAYRTITHGLTLGKNKANLRKELQPSHGLRKFFENCLDRVGMDHNKKLQLEGHSQGVRNAYTSQQVEQLRDLYKQAYQYLDLSEEAAAESRVKDLEKIVAEQRQHIDALKSEISSQGSLVQLIREIGPDGVRVLEQLIKEKMGKK